MNIIVNMSCVSTITNTFLLDIRLELTIVSKKLKTKCTKLHNNLAHEEQNGISQALGNRIISNHGRYILEQSFKCGYMFLTIRYLFLPEKSNSVIISISTFSHEFFTMSCFRVYIIMFPGIYNHVSGYI